VLGDCHEFIQLLLVVFDAAKGEVHFQCLGALHKARWMAKWIYMYGLKIAFAVTSSRQLPSGTIPSRHQVP